MTGDEGPRAAVTALIGLAAAAEQEVLAEPRPDAGCSAAHWAAAPTVAHNTEFRRQQVQRLRAIRCGRTPPEFEEADHASAALYAELSAQPADAAARDSWRVAGELAEEMRLASREDLLEPARNPWLRGRQLDEAVASLADAITLNPDIRANARHDKDLAGVRNAEAIAVLLAG